MSNFTPYYCMARQGGKRHLVTELNRREFANSVKFIRLNDPVTEEADLKQIAKDDKEFKKNPPLVGRQKRQARLNRSLKGVDKAGIADISEVTPELVKEEAPVVEAPAKAEKPKPTKEQQAAARKKSREKKAAARKKSQEDAKKAADEAAAKDAE